MFILFVWPSTVIMALTESFFNDSMSGQGVLCRPQQFLSLIILSFGDLLVKKVKNKSSVSTFVFDKLHLLSRCIYEPVSVHCCA